MFVRKIAAAVLLAFAARDLAAARRPVAQWDVIPYQLVKEPFKAGVVAFYDKPFKVEFTVNGRRAAVVDKPSLNDRTKVEEHWFSLDPAKYDRASLVDYRLRLGARVVAEDGTKHILPEIDLYWNADGSVGSTKTIWLDVKDGIDYSDGTKERPVKTMKQAVKLAGDGGTVYLSKPGNYTAERIGGRNNRKYWTTIQPAPGLTRRDVQIKGGRTGCDKLHFKDVQIYSDIVNGTSYALGGVDDKSSCWLENCIVRDKGGRLSGRSYTFGNKLIGYVTGGATTEMGDGPRCRLVRNHVIKSISGDAFSGADLLAVNCKLVDVDSTGVMDEPAFHRSQGIQGAWTHDVILANITAQNCACNGFIGLKLRDSAFSNIELGTVGPERRFVSRYAWEMENVWFDRVRVTGQEWIWFKATNHNGDFAPTDVRVTDCSFELPKAEEE
ncbi:MAG: hypothetical protein IJ829_06220 [Kiritimatiellae bacterium]|nr:hypothetical protein [Kiritimatiellia bacterium]